LNAKQILVRALILGSLGLILAGCGQTGSLYLPSPPVAAAPK